MPRFFLIHKVIELPDSQDWWVDDFKGLRERSLARGEEKAAWLNSWFSSKDSVMICEWEARSEEDILACFTHEELAMAPIQDTFEVAHMDPGWLDN